MFLCLVLNGVLGTFNLIQHHITLSLISFCAVAVLGVAGLFVLRELREQDRWLARLNAERKMFQDSNEKAFNNLQKVLVALHGRWHSNDTIVIPVVWNGLQLEAIIAPGYVSCGSYSTCYYIPHAPDIPPSEIIASAALALHNDPTVIARWYSRMGAHV
jgi:hypothetical protein